MSTCVCARVCVYGGGWAGVHFLPWMRPLPSFPSRTFPALPVGPVGGPASVSPAWSLWRPVPQSLHHPEGREPAGGWGVGERSLLPSQRDLWDLLLFPFKDARETLHLIPGVVSNKPLYNSA